MALIKHIFLVLIFSGLISIKVSGQKSSIDLPVNSEYNTALELFEKEKFSAAQRMFLDLIANPAYENTLVKSNSEYYALLCAIELFNEDAEVLADRFLAANPENNHVNTVFFRMGKYQYAKKRYRPAIEYFSKVNKSDLNEDDQAELTFKRGYSWLMIDSLDKARSCFYEIKDIDTKYTSPAIYFYSHIAYVQKKFETAIEGFNRLKDDETFAELVPYYISQCYYFQEKWDAILVYTRPLIDSVVETRIAEMARITADAYYHKKLYKDAIPYYEKYFDKGKDFKPADYFQAGYCYYVEGSYDKASKMLEKSSSGNTSISQNSNYILGDCYIKLKLKDRALLAFAAASKADADSSIKEDATFNYAVLSYELNNSAFSNAIKNLNEYITKYPDSRRNDEAYHYLVTACLNTHNYNDALSYLDKIKSKDKDARKAYQRAAFFKGLEFFNDLKFDEALKYFDLSLKNASSDPIIAARTYYWTAEAQYRLGNVDEALDNYNVFLASENAKTLKEYKLASYNVAYCFFNKKDYGAAAERFNKYVDNSKLSKDKILADAYNRLGDCKFSAAKYSEAIEYYSKSIDLALSDKDYAIYQKAFALGLQNDHKEKIRLLNQLITSMPESNYIDDALYEIGRSQVALQRPDEAKKSYNKIISDFPASSFVKKALLQLGLVEYNQGNNKAAIEKYKKVISDYPNTQEAKSALSGLKNIYVEMNDVDSYIKYTETLGSFANVSVSEKDSLLYYSGENTYISGDCKGAAIKFKTYLDKYPQGNFTLNAWYYIADCSYKAGDIDNALKAFDYVISKKQNNFTEQALASAAEIHVKIGDYKSALANYQMLDSVAEIDENIIAALTGQMQAYLKLNQFDDAIKAAEKVLRKPGIQQETERQARFVIAKAYIALNQNDKASEYFKKLAVDVKNSEGAEAKYRIAEILFNQGKQDKAEKEVFSFIDMNSPHQYWVAKAYILLAGIYHNKKDDFQAVNTLQSIIDNYDNKDDGIIIEAQEKKDSIDGKSAPVEKKIQDEDPEIGL